MDEVQIMRLPPYQAKHYLAEDAIFGLPDRRGSREDFRKRRRPIGRLGAGQPGAVALPTLAEAFGASFQQAQWVVLAYLLATTALIVSAGRLGDIVGRRRLLMVGIGLFTVGSALCAAAPGLGWLIAAMGLLGTMSAVGTALGPSLGGGLALVLARRCLPTDRQTLKADQAHFDHLGTLLLALTLAAYALAMTVGRGRFGPFYLAHALGLGTALVGVILSVGPVVAAFTGVPAGRAVDRFGPHRTSAGGLIGMVLLAVRLWRTAQQHHQAPQDERRLNLRMLPLVGMVGGCSMGLLGIGGGLMAGPLLSGWMGQRQTTAQGLSLALVAPSSVVALATYAGAHRVDWALGVPMALGGVLTVSAGVALAHRLPEKPMRLSFAAILMATAFWLVAGPQPIH